jgi:hypothetical protein
LPTLVLLGRTGRFLSFSDPGMEPGAELREVDRDYQSISRTERQGSGGSIAIGAGKDDDTGRGAGLSSG